MKIDTRQADKLCALLRDNGIPYQTVIHHYAMGLDMQVCIPSTEAWSRKKGLNVAINAITYGHKEGLLEFWDGKRDEPVGYLTAEEALKLIQERM